MLPGVLALPVLFAAIAGLAVALWISRPVPRDASLHTVTSVVFLAAMLLCSVAVAFDDRVDDVMYQDPAFPEVTTRTEFSDELKPLWLKALARPESELQRMAADTIALAHRAGMQELDDTVDELLAILQQDPLEPSVRRAVTNALVTLDAEHAAQPLADGLATGGLELARIVEAALARWDYEPARAIWRQRLSDPEAERDRLQLAIQCLGIVKDTEALSVLLQITSDVNAAAPIRIAAARASAQINHRDVTVAADELASAARDQPTASLLAATLLTEQNSTEAVSILKGLVAVESRTVRGLALRRLFEIDPAHVYEFAAASLRSPDVNIRRVGCEALVHRADAEAIAQLAPTLDDVNPGLRRYVSQSLIRLAEQAPLREAVIQATADVVVQDSWRGLEQGIFVLAALDHEPVAPRLLELLTHRRPEVLVTAAWGLRKLAVSDTLPTMLDHAERQTASIVDDTADLKYLEAIDAQLSQLFQAFGELGHEEAEPLMRKYIPKDLLYAGATRPAAVWAIGKLHEGRADDALARVLAARLADSTSLMPELESVRRMSAIGIGRMKAESQLATVREFLIEAPSTPGLACAWALERMTGETHEFSFEWARAAGGWFLSPRFRIEPNETD